jgi:hypothetical protein
LGSDTGGRYLGPSDTEAIAMADTQPSEALLNAIGEQPGVDDRPTPEVEVYAAPGTILVLDPIEDLRPWIVEANSTKRPIVDAVGDVDPAIQTETTDAIALAKAFVALVKVKEQLEAATKTISDKIKGVDLAIVKAFEANGLERLSVLGQTIYVRTERVANKAPGVATEALIEALRDCQQADPDTNAEALVREGVSAQSLKAWVKELETDEDGFPIIPTTKLANLIKIYDRKDTRMTKSSA